MKSFGWQRDASPYEISRSQRMLDCIGPEVEVFFLTTRRLCLPYTVVVDLRVSFVSPSAGPPVICLIKPDIIMTSLQ